MSSSQSGPTTGREKLLIATGCCVCAVLIGRQIYHSLVYSAQHPQTLRPRQKHRLLVRAVNIDPALLAALESSPLSTKFILEPASVVVYDDSSSAASVDLQAKQLALQGYLQHHGPCISALHSITIAGASPDIFQTPREVVRRSAGAEMKIRTVIALTIDGTNCAVFSKSLKGYVGTPLQGTGDDEEQDGTHEKEKRCLQLEDSFTSGAQTFGHLSRCICFKTIFAGTHVDRDAAANWAIVMSPERRSINRCLFSCIAASADALAAHLQYGWQHDPPQPTLSGTLREALRPSKLLLSKKCAPLKKAAHAPFEMSITFRASSKEVERRCIAALQEAAAGARLVSPQFKKPLNRSSTTTGASTSSLDSTDGGSSWKPRPMTVSLSCSSTNPSNGASCMSVLEALDVMRLQAQTFALQPCHVEQMKLLLPVPLPGACLSPENHPYMMLHADGCGICPVEDDQCGSLPAMQHFESHIVVKMATHAAAAADVLNACVRQHNGHLVTVPFVVHAPPTQDDRRAHPLRLIVLRHFGMGYNSCAKKLSALAADVEACCSKSSLGEVLSCHAYFVVYDSEPMVKHDSPHGWERDGDDGWEVIDG